MPRPISQVILNRVPMPQPIDHAREPLVSSPVLTNGQREPSPLLVGAHSDSDPRVRLASGKGGMRGHRRLNVTLWLDYAVVHHPIHCRTRHVR